MNVPKSVNIAVMLVRCSLALGLINAAITAVALARGRSDAIPLAVALATVAVVTAFAIFWLSQKVRSRANLARVALIAIATITLFAVARDVPTSFQNSVGQGLVVAACYALFYIAAIILLLPNVHRWFTKG